MFSIILTYLDAVSYASLRIRDILDSGCCSSSICNLPEAVCTVNFCADDSCREVGKDLLEFVIVGIHGSLIVELATGKGCATTFFPCTPGTNHLHLLLHLHSEHFAREVLYELNIARNIHKHPARLALVWEPLNLNGRVWDAVLVAVRTGKVLILTISLAAVCKPPVNMILVEIENMVIDGHALREVSLNVGNELLNRIQHIS